MKLLNNKAKYSKCCKHKVILMGDSHLRGSAAKMIASLDARFDVCGVKPGSITGSLTFKRRIKSHLPFAVIIRSSQYFPRFQDKG